MTKPLRHYSDGDNLWPTAAAQSCNTVSGAPLTDVENYQPYKFGGLADAFYIEAGVNDQVVITYPSIVGTTYTRTLTPGGYTADELALEVETWLAGTPLPTPVVSWNAIATRKFHISAGAAFDLNWNTGGARAQGLATHMGYSNSADDTGLAAYAADAATYIMAEQWYGIDLGSDKAIECVMMYSTSLYHEASASIQIFGSSSAIGWAGDSPADWVGSTYEGEKRSSTRSKRNDLYIWLPGETIRYLAVFIDRPGITQATAAYTKLGVGGIWVNAAFDGADYSDSTFVQPWQRMAVNGQVRNVPAAGGAMGLAAVRGVEGRRLRFSGWSEGTFRTFEDYWDRNGSRPGLWMMDPDDIDAGAHGHDKAIWGYIESMGEITGRGTTHVRDWDMVLRSVPMAPEGVL